MKADAVRAVVRSAFVRLPPQFPISAGNIRDAVSRSWRHPRPLPARLRQAAADASAAMAWPAAVHSVADHIVHLVRYHAGAPVSRRLRPARHPASDGPAEPRRSVAGYFARL